MTITEMCSSCMRKNYCPAAYKKEHWCGNHIGRIGMENKEDVMNAL